MQKNVNIVLDDALFALIQEKLPYLGYESLTDLVKDAFQLRVEALLQSIVLYQVSR